MPISINGKSVASMSIDGNVVYNAPSGTKPITQNGTGIDVAAYQYVDVNVSEQLNTNYFFIESGPYATDVSLTSSDNSYYPIIYYSVDNKQTWNQLSPSTIIHLNQNSKVYFYGDNVLGVPRYRSFA